MLNVGEHLTFGLYLLAGPVLGGAFLFALIKGRKRMMLMRRIEHRTFDSSNADTVSIIIPARNEQERIADCLRSALAQNYPAIEVIAVNDRSTDGTGQAMDAVAADAGGRLKVIHLRDDPPSGWTGKCRAVHMGVGHAKGQWLLFVDSDVVLQPGALPATMSLAIAKKAGLVSLMPKLECHSFWEELLIPLSGCMLNLVHLAALTNNDHHPAAFANGQYMLFRRGMYESIGGHAAVGDRFCEDIAFAQIAKGAGHRIRVSWGADLAAVRMYDSLAAIRRGWSRIFFAAGMGRPGRIVLGMALVLFGWYSGIAALAWGVFRDAEPVSLDGAWVIAAMVHLSLLAGSLGMVYSWSGNRRWMGLAWPLGAAMLLGILVRSLVMCLTGKVEWRGMQYQHRQRERVAVADLPEDASV